MKPIKKVIGFNVPAPESEVKTDPESVPVPELSAEEQELKKYIESSFAPDGESENIEFLSTTELQFEMSEFNNFSLSVINKILNMLEYKQEFMDGHPCWVMFRKNNFE